MSHPGAWAGLEAGAASRSGTNRRPQLFKEARRRPSLEAAWATCILSSGDSPSGLEGLSAITGKEGIGKNRCGNAVGEIGRRAICSGRAVL